MLRSRSLESMSRVEGDLPAWEDLRDLAKEEKFRDLAK